MPLQTPSKVSLESAIRDAFKRAADDGASPGADSAAITQKLASDIATAIDAHIKGAVVTVNIVPGATTASSS